MKAGVINLVDTESQIEGVAVVKVDNGIYGLCQRDEQGRVHQVIVTEAMLERLRHPAMALAA